MSFFEKGLDVSYLSQLVPCNIMLSEDYYAVYTLAELLSRTEGPLYTSIRGQGYAYGAGISIYKWHSQLCFNAREVSSPKESTFSFNYFNEKQQKEVE